MLLLTAAAFWWAKGMAFNERGHDAIGGEYRGRDNLSCRRRAAVLRWYRGALWAKAYDCGKHYHDGYRLTGEPEFHMIGVYRFKPGLVKSTTRYYFYGNYPFGSIERQDKPLAKGRWNIHGPFHANAEYVMGYKERPRTFVRNFSTFPIR